MSDDLPGSVAPEEADASLAAGAAWAYGQSQPHEYAAYLTNTGRDQEAVDFLPGWMGLKAARDGAARR